MEELKGLVSNLQERFKDKEKINARDLLRAIVMITEQMDRMDKEIEEKVDVKVPHSR